MVRLSDAPIDESRAPRHRLRLRSEICGREILGDPRVVLGCLPGPDFSARDPHPGEFPDTRGRRLFGWRVAWILRDQSDPTISLILLRNDTVVGLDLVSDYRHVLGRDVRNDARDH